MQFFIYGLRDPRDQKIRYVGQSTRGMGRPLEHCKPSVLTKNARTYKTRWIKSLLRIGLMYEVVVLQRCNSVDVLNDAERFWISTGKAAGTLTNATDGGEGTRGWKMPKQQRQNIIKVLAANLPTRGFSGRQHREETKIKIAQSLKLNPPTKGPLLEETKRKIAAAHVGTKASHETRAKMSATHKARIRPRKAACKCGSIGPFVKSQRTRDGFTRICLKCEAARTLARHYATHR